MDTIIFIAVSFFIVLGYYMVKSMKDQNTKEASELRIPIWRYKKYKEIYDEQLEYLKKGKNPPNRMNEISNMNEWRRYVECRCGKPLTIKNEEEWLDELDGTAIRNEDRIKSTSGVEGVVTQVMTDGYVVLTANNRSEFVKRDEVAEHIPYGQNGETEEVVPSEEPLSVANQGTMEDFMNRILREAKTPQEKTQQMLQAIAFCKEKNLFRPGEMEVKTKEQKFHLGLKAILRMELYKRAHPEK